MKYQLFCMYPGQGSRPKTWHPIGKLAGNRDKIITKSKKANQEFEIPRQSYPKVMETHAENSGFRGKVTLSARKGNTKIMQSCAKVAELATQPSDSSKTNYTPMVLHGSQDQEVAQRRGIQS